MDAVRGLDDHFVAGLREILAWAALRGITFHSRFHTYSGTIEWLRAHDKDEEERAHVYTQLNAAGRLTEILSTYTESIELFETISALRQHGVTVPLALLRKVFSGPVDLFRENPTSSEARNGMFELSMGAMAARRGLHPTLSDTNPDVAFRFEDRFVKMECKRVLSEKRIEERLKEGVKQLEKTVNPNSLDVGLVAISLSKLANPGDRYLVSASPHDDLSQELDNRLKANERLLARMHRPHVTGFLFYLSSAAHVPGKGFTTMNSGTVFPLDMRQEPFLRRLTGELSV